jgi:hypothetical protein
MNSEYESYVTTDGQSASLFWNKGPIWGLRLDFYYCQTVCGFIYVSRSLWREDESVVYNFCWPSPAQSFSGPSPVGLVTIFYCLRFETSLFIASDYSQGYGGGIRPWPHTGIDEWSQSHIATDGQSVCLGVEPRLGLLTRCFFLFDSYCPVHVGTPLWREVGSVVCQSWSVVLVHCHLYNYLQFHY